MTAVYCKKFCYNGARTIFARPININGGSVLQQHVCKVLRLRCE